MTYTLVPKVLPGKEDGQRLYYAQSRARGELGLEEMAERISRNCTLTRSDIIGCWRRWRMKCARGCATVRL